MVEEERTHPLSYAVLTDHTGPPIEGTIFRGAGSAVAATVVAIALGYVGLFVVPSQRLLSWTLALAVPVVGFLVPLRRLKASLPERRRKATIFIGVVALGCFAVTLNSISDMRPYFPQLAAALSDSELPDGYERVSEERLGDRLGRDGYPRIERRFSVPAGVDDPVRVIMASLYDHGWKPADENLAPELNNAALKNGLRLDLAPLEGGLVRILIDSY